MAPYFEETGAPSAPETTFQRCRVMADPPLTTAPGYTTSSIVHIVIRSAQGFQRVHRSYVVRIPGYGLTTSWG